MNDLLNFFRGGSHVDSSGTAREFTQDDLAKTQKYYDPAKHEAPIVIGHPKDNAPAYGWVEKIAEKAGNLFASEKQVNPDFAEMRKTGAFKKLSASFYEPKSANHPLKNEEGWDSFYLKHIGFLGAQAPAIKGLQQIAFNDSEVGVIQFSEFMDYECMTQARLWRGLREFLITKHSLQEIDEVLPTYLIDELMISASKDNEIEAPMTTEPTVNYAEQTAENERLRAENAQLRKDRQETQFSEFLDSLKGKITPGEKPGLIALMGNLAGNGEVSFAEAGTTKNQSALDVFKETLKMRPVIIDFNESPEAIEPNSDPEAVAKEAQKLQFAERAAGNDISISEAVARVQKGGAK